MWRRFRVPCGAGKLLVNSQEYKEGNKVAKPGMHFIVLEATDGSYFTLPDEPAVHVRGNIVSQCARKLLQSFLLKTVAATGHTCDDDESEAENAYDDPDITPLRLLPSALEKFLNPLLIGNTPDRDERQRDDPSRETFCRRYLIATQPRRVSSVDLKCPQRALQMQSKIQGHQWHRSHRSLQQHQAGSHGMTTPVPLLFRSALLMLQPPHRLLLLLVHHHVCRYFVSFSVRVTHRSFISPHPIAHHPPQ